MVMFMNSALAASIGTRIRQLRLSHNWSQTELARRIGVNKSVISFYELGARFPTYDNLVRICDIFGVSTDYLIRGREVMKMDVDSLPSDQINALRTIIAALQHQNNDSSQI